MTTPTLLRPDQRPPDGAIDLGIRQIDGGTLAHQATRIIATTWGPEHAAILRSLLGIYSIRPDGPTNLEALGHDTRVYFKVESAHGVGTGSIQFHIRLWVGKS